MLYKSAFANVGAFGVCELTSKGSGTRAKVWILRYVKFNIIGFAGFLLGSAIYSASFDTIGSWAWIAANGMGGVLQFLLIGYFNTKKKGKMFDSCT